MPSPLNGGWHFLYAMHGVVDLNQAVEGTLKMLHRLIGGDIDLS
ncbi:hypothetical protein [Desulfosarcina ovata]